MYRFIISDEVKWTKVPSFKGLSTEDIFEFGESEMDLSSYLPDYKEKALFPNRDFVCNIGKNHYCNFAIKQSVLY